MKIKSLIFILGLYFCQSAIAETFVAGEDYIVLNNEPAQSQYGLVEYFSFRCPACYKIEPLIEEMETQLSPMKLNRVHVDFGNQESKLSQITFALLSVLHAEHLIDEIFHRFHRGRGAFRSEEELLSFFQEKGFDKNDVANKITSFTSQSLIKSFNKKAKDNSIRRIPTLIINNKYQIVNRSIESGKQFAALVSHLTALP